MFYKREFCTKSYTTANMLQPTKHPNFVPRGNDKLTYFSKMPINL